MLFGETIPYSQGQATLDVRVVGGGLLFCLFDINRKEIVASTFPIPEEANIPPDVVFVPDNETELLQLLLEQELLLPEPVGDGKAVNREFNQTLRFSAYRANPAKSDEIKAHIVGKMLIRHLFGSRPSDA